MERPAFSVLMANYNNGRYIDDAIRSVLAQSFRDWELVIVDDGSTDDSLARINKYINDPRIRLFPRKNNEGIAKSQIFGLTKVQSKIVGILDSDDALVPQAIEKAYTTHIQRPQLGLVLSQAAICDQNLNPVYTLTTSCERLAEPMLWMRGPTHFRTFKFDAYKATSGLLNCARSCAEDWDLIFKLEEVAPAIIINEALYLHRQTQDSLSRGAANRHYSLRGLGLAIYRAYLRRRGTSIPSLPRFVVAAWLIAAVRFSLELGQRRAGLAFALRTLRVASFSPASYRAIRLAMQALCKPRDRRPHGDKRFYPVLRLQTNTGNIAPDRIECIPMLHKRGHALFGGDELLLFDASYVVTFELEIDGFSFSQDPIIVLDVFANLPQQTVLVQRQINRAEVGKGRRNFNVEFKGQTGQRVEFRVFWGEQCLLKVYGVTLQRLPQSSH
jgi:glycosyltransferase involved in cell wall biosynthesis